MDGTGLSRPIHWYPGHMARGLRELREKLRLIDVVVQLLDARAPLATRNFQLADALGQKPCIIVLTKADLAQPGATSAWLAAFRAAGDQALAVSADGRGYAALRKALRAYAPERPAAIARALPPARAVRALVCGIPNVGKSTLVNRIIGHRRARVGARPGVTRAQQWLEGNGVAFLDTPGLLWPKLSDEAQAVRLAWLGAIDLKLLDARTLASRLLDYLAQHHESLLHRLGVDGEAISSQPPPSGIDAPADADADAGAAMVERGRVALAQVAARRGMLGAGGAPELDRAAEVVLSEFAQGKLGRVSLERPSRPSARQKEPPGED